MQLDGKVTAVLYLYDRDIHRFSEVETSLLSVLADQAAIAIKNARLYTELARRVKQLEILPTIYEKIIAMGIQNVDSILDLLYSIACKVMNLSDAQVQFAFYDADKEQGDLPLAVERDSGQLIDRVRWGSRELNQSRGRGRTSPSFPAQIPWKQVRLDRVRHPYRRNQFHPNEFLGDGKCSKGRRAACARSADIRPA